MLCTYPVQMECGQERQTGSIESGVIVEIVYQAWKLPFCVLTAGNVLAWFCAPSIPYTSLICIILDVCGQR